MKSVSMIIAGAANPHVRNYYPQFLKENSLLNVLAIADHDKERLDYAKNFFAGTNYDVKFYDDWRKMFDAHQDAESVMLGSDNFYHYEIAKEAMLRKKHIYSMKVVSMDEAQCGELIKLRDEKKLVFQVELELHFSPQYRYARKLAQEGKFGDIKSIYLSNISLSPIIYFPNWGEPELSYGKTIPIRPGDKICRGGALTDHPHPFDMIHWITGAEFKKIYAISGKNQRDYLKVEDHVAITGQLDNGAIFFINPSYSHIEEKVNTRRLYWPKSLEVNLKINGSRGYYATDFCDKHIYILGSGYVSPNRLMVQGAGKAKRDPHDNMLDSFALSVQGEREVESSLEDGLRAVKAMNAAYESLYRGEAVEL